MKILHVNQIDGHGGAAGICLALHRRFLADGHQSAVLVGRRSRQVPGVALLENDRYRPTWGRFWMAAARGLRRYSGRIPGAYRVSERWLPRMASYAQCRSWWAGQENFDFPGTGHLLEQAPFVPDVLHLHNLHGGYFDLRELPRLGREVPTIITLHDAWLLAGHCAHSFDCERWKTGCGSCPRRDIPPVVRRDASAFNWQRKREIFRESRVSVVCPAQWLADKVRQSILMPAAGRLRVVPNGVDTSVFKPGDKAAARERLGWSREACVVMFAANGVRQCIYKDFATMREAVRLAASVATGRPLRFVVVGETAPPEQLENARIEFLPHRDSMAECYQGADLYIHAAKTDTFPLTVLEALASGLPVVATAVGGIPEQIIHGETGFLVPEGDAPALAKQVARLAQSRELALAMGAAAVRDAAHRFSLKSMAERYLQLYREVIAEKNEDRA